MKRDETKENGLYIMERPKGQRADGSNYTALPLVEKYVSLKTGVRHNAKAGYETVV